MTVTILQGDVRDMLHTLPAESVQCVVTSPPYFQLRDYGVAGQIGLEQTPAEFIAALVDVFREVRRVLRPDGVVFVNIGDSYAGSGKGPTGTSGIGDQSRRQGFTGVSDKSTLKGYTAGSQLKNAILGGGVGVEGLRAKNLLLIPERLAIAMQDRGWYVRSRIAWCKLSAMPESVKDRPTSAWEHIWMFTKSARYFWDADAVRQPQTGGTHSRGKGAQGAPKITVPGRGIKNNGSFQAAMVHDAPTDGLANLRNYWLLSPEPNREAHYAAFPSEIPKRCILAGSRKGDTVLDPFLGTGTTALVADRLGRHAVGVELNPKYAEIARRRISNDAPMFAEVQVEAGQQLEMPA